MFASAPCPFPTSMRYPVLALALVFCLALSGVALSAPAGATWYRQAVAYDRAKLNLPADSQRVLEAGNLGAGGMVTGWVEFDVKTQTSGWHELLVEGHGGGVTYVLDADSPATQTLNGTFERDGGYERAGNFWLSAGRHRLRLVRDLWTGFPSIAAVALRPAQGELTKMLAVSPLSDRRLFRVHECEKVQILFGGNVRAQDLRVSLLDLATKARQDVQTVSLPPSSGLSKKDLSLPCSRPGRFSLRIGAAEAGSSAPLLKDFDYEVFTAASPTAQVNKSREQSATAAKETPVVEIACADREPDFSSEPSRIVGAGRQAYRESGSTGWTGYIRADAARRSAMKEPSWFAYALDGFVRQQGYRIEIDYPDDAIRTFAIVLREDLSIGYPPSIGAESDGGNISGLGYATVTMDIWPRTEKPRLLFVTAHDGERAACSRIRIFTGLPVQSPVQARPDGQSHRQFFHWYEEGSSFASLFGAPDIRWAGMQTAIERWLDTAASNGVGTIIPTVSVYSFQLYPSKVIRSFAPDHDDDTLRRIMFEAERRRMAVIPELAPRTDDLGFGYGDGKAVPPSVAVSRNGHTDFYSATGTRVTATYNALSPTTQDWYLSLVGELADRYRDSPSFRGVSIRLMSWGNYGLNNLVSLDWGYDDTTISAFQKDTGILVGTNDPGSADRFANRHRWLMGNAREQWIAWRCQRLAQLIVRIRDRLRQARPDLDLYINIFDGGKRRDIPSFSRHSRANGFVASLREMGIDPARLAQIPGVKLINAAHRYGRREANAEERGARDSLLDPIPLGSLVTAESAHFLFAGEYLEMTSEVAPPATLGFSAATKPRWAGAHAALAGRKALERYAIALAEHDALSLGDGGNGYVFGSPEVAAFMREFSLLPAARFGDRTDAKDPVRVRELRGKTETTFYAISRVPFDSTLDVGLSAPARVTRLATAKAFPNGRSISITLRPYELLVGHIEGAARIESVKTTIPQPARQIAAKQVEWIEGKARLSLPTGAKSPLSEKDRQLLEDAASASRKALNEGWLWRAGSVLEHSELLNIYRKIAESPPNIPTPR